VKIQIVSFICVCVQEKQSVTASVYLSSAITLGPWLRPVRTSTLLVLVLRQLQFSSVQTLYTTTNAFTRESSDRKIPDCVDSHLNILYNAAAQYRDDHRAKNEQTDQRTD